MKKIIITGTSEMTAKGNRSNRRCKPVICIDTGVVYTSVSDAAEQNGVDQSAISMVCTGKSKFSKGKRYCFVSDMSEHYEDIAKHMRTMYETYAKVEQERKAEEERQFTEKAKQERIERAKIKYNKACAQYNKARETFENARAELIASGATEI